MNPSALEDLWTVVRLAAEGSDWKRDEGETLCAWAQRTLRAPRPEEGTIAVPQDVLVRSIRILRNTMCNETADALERLLPQKERE